MALSDEIKDGLSFLKDVQAKAKDNKADLQKAADEVQRVADALKGLAKGDPAKLNVTMTQFENVNKLLLAQASAEDELTKSASPDWNKIGDGVAIVVGIAVKIGLAVAGV